jgi:tellurite resistance protein
MTSEQELPLLTNAGINDLDPIFKVRDYALNNVMMVIAADGIFKEEEVDFTKKLAKKLGYDNDKLAGMYDLAKNNQLTIRLPENRKGALKVYEMMLKAAAADGTISAEERLILDDVQKRISVIPA